MSKKSPAETIIFCQYCGSLEGMYPLESEAPKAFSCSKCGTGQRTVKGRPQINQIAGRNATGHILPPGR